MKDLLYIIYGKCLTMMASHSLFCLLRTDSNHFQTREDQRPLSVFTAHWPLQIWKMLQGTPPEICFWTFWWYPLKPVMKFWKRHSPEMETGNRNSAITKCSCVTVSNDRSAKSIFLVHQYAGQVLNTGRNDLTTARNCGVWCTGLSISL